MFNLFLQTTDSVTIEPVKNLNSLEFNPKVLEETLNNCERNNHSLALIVDKNNYDSFHNTFPDIVTLGNDPRCSATAVNDDNIDDFINQKLQNVYLFVDSEKNLASNFEKIYKYVNGWIELKFKDIKEYDEKLLDNQLSLIYETVKELDKTENRVIVKQMNGYRIKEKFNQFGEKNFFIGLDGNVYSHPSLYYQKMKNICNIKDFNLLDDTYYLQTQPHLICVMCETFWCDRGIVNNKKYTSEYKVPCTGSCKLNSILTKYSRMMYNENIANIFTDVNCNLDKADDFEAFKYYEEFLKNDCVCNRIKKLNFEEREIWSNYEYHL